MGKGYKLPDVGLLGYLVVILQDMGEAENVGNGILNPNSWQKVQSFCELTETRLGYRELVSLVQLSRSYANMFNRANGFNYPHPMQKEVIVSAEQTERELLKAFGF